MTLEGKEQQGGMPFVIRELPISERERLARQREISHAQRARTDPYGTPEVLYIVPRAAGSIDFRQSAEQR